MVHFFKQIGFYDTNQQKGNVIEHTAVVKPISNGTWVEFVGWSTVVSYIIYFGLGGFLHVKNIITTKKKHSVIKKYNLTININIFL